MPQKNQKIAKNGVWRTMRLTTVNANAYAGRNLSHSERSISSSMLSIRWLPRKNRGGDQERSEDLFWICRLKEKARWLPISFEGRLTSGPEEICDLFAEFIQQTCADDVWVPSDSGALQFTSDEVVSVLQDLDVNKGSGPDGISPIILKNCASAFVKPLSLLFDRSMATSVFPNRLDRARSELHKQSRSHHGRENYFFGACGRHVCKGLCDEKYKLLENFEYWRNYRFFLLLFFLQFFSKACPINIQVDLSQPG
jgi:hypothetical protein